jgi:hypothetical protein
MGKYEPLGDFLRKQRMDQIVLTFGEIERIVLLTRDRPLLQYAEQGHIQAIPC